MTEKRHQTKIYSYIYNEQYTDCISPSLLTIKIIQFFHRQRYNLLQHTNGSFHISHILYQHTPSAVLLTQVTAPGIFHHVIYHFAKRLTLIERTIRIGDKE